MVFCDDLLWILLTVFGGFSFGCFLIVILRNHRAKEFKVSKDFMNILFYSSSKSV